MVGDADCRVDRLLLHRKCAVEKGVSKRQEKRRGEPVGGDEKRGRVHLKRRKGNVVFVVHVEHVAS